MFYDHQSDPNEWTNLASNPDYKEEMDVLKQKLPKVNARWDAHSRYTFQPYFVEQKARTSTAQEASQ